MYRKFWFINSLNEKYELTNRNSKIFLNAPTGLGFSKQFITTRYRSFERVLNVEYNMPTPSGELLFYERGNNVIYQDYQDFIQFIKHRPLKFYYQLPNSFDSYYIDCEIAQIDKSEIGTDTILHCPIIIKGNSFWKNAKENELVVSQEIEGDAKTYPYTYPYTYGGNSFSHIDISSNGTLESGFEFIIEHEVSNPTLSLYQNNVKYGEIKINGTYDRVIVNTKDGEQSIYLEYQGSVIANPTSYFDLSGNGDYITPFPKLNVGNSVLTFSYGGEYEDEIKIRWNDIYSSV